MAKSKNRVKSPPTGPGAEQPVRWSWQWPLLLVLATCLAYIPLLWAGFIWDDSPLLVKNELVQQPGGLYRIWFTTAPIDYWPVTNTTFWLEWRLWGPHPLGYHITNLLLHLAASLLVWRVLKSLAIPGAFLAALLFAVHPVNVEAVAWIAQRKTILASAFFLLSVLWYVKADSATSANRLVGFGRWYWLSLLAFALGMLSKGSIAMLPLILLLIIWWRQGSIRTWDLWRIAPFLLVAVPLVLVNMWFQNHNSTGMIHEVGLPERLAGAGAVIWFYLWKALLPINLAFVYPQWQIDASDLRWWLPLAAAVAVTVLLFWKQNGRWGGPLFFAWAYYCLALAPVLGLTYITFMYYTLVADHYQYLAIIAVVALVGTGFCLWRQKVAAAMQPSAMGAAVVVVGVLMALTYTQTSLYCNEMTLWQATIDKNPRSWIANYWVGKILFDEGQSQRALEPLERAVQISPNDAEAQCMLSSALLNERRADEAIAHAQEALRMKADYPEAHYNLGSALLLQGRLPEAVAALNQAVQLRPEYARAYANLAAALAGLNRRAEAVAAAEKAIELARSQGNAQELQQIEAWLARYRAGLP